MTHNQMSLLSSYCKNGRAKKQGKITKSISLFKEFLKSDWKLRYLPRCHGIGFTFCYFHSENSGWFQQDLETDANCVGEIVLCLII